MRLQHRRLSFTSFPFDYAVFASMCATSAPYLHIIIPTGRPMVVPRRVCFRLRYIMFSTQFALYGFLCLLHLLFLFSMLCTVLLCLRILAFFIFLLVYDDSSSVLILSHHLLRSLIPLLCFILARLHRFLLFLLLLLIILHHHHHDHHHHHCHHHLRRFLSCFSFF